MTKLTYPLTVDTLGKVKALGSRISVNCNICHKHTMLDMDKLIERQDELNVAGEAGGHHTPNERKKFDTRSVP